MNLLDPFRLWPPWLLRSAIQMLLAFFCRLVLAVLAAEDRRYHENGLAPRVPKSAETESDDVESDSNASCPQVESSFVLSLLSD